MAIDRLCDGFSFIEDLGCYFIYKKENKNMSKNKFIYGIAAVKFKEKTVGYIEKGSWDWGGSKPESTDVEAEQVPDAPVLTLLQKNSQVSPSFNLIQLDYENLQAVLGGKLVETGQDPNKKVTGWQAPSTLVELRGPWEIQFVSGQTMKIPNGTILASLGGKLTLTEVSKVECQLKVNKPENGGAPYEINDSVSEG